MNIVESHATDYGEMTGYMAPEIITATATTPSTALEHQLYAAAHCMVSERHEKDALVNMVYALLKRDHKDRGE